eukprot:jgi/Ulvmu1/5647/UM231_0010.1
MLPVAKLSSKRSVCAGAQASSSEGGRPATTSSKSKTTSSKSRIVRVPNNPAVAEFYGPNRRFYLPDMEPPAWLDGTMAGDHGCDFLGICSDTRTIDQFRRGEVMNGRFAMLGTVGMLVPEILASNGVEGIKGARWFETGSAMLNGETLNYFGTPIPINLQGVIITNAALVFLAEWFRWQEFAPGYEPNCDDTLYPGGPFDPLGLADTDADTLKLLKVNEVRNGRLAKTAFLGMVWQAYITRKGPWENLQDHIRDPFNNNIFTNWPADPSSVSL